MIGSGSFEQDLKRAVLAYGDAWCSASPVYDKDHVFSDKYKAQKQAILARAARRKKTRSIVQGFAASFAVLLLSFGMVMAFSQDARATFINWTLNIYNGIADFQFYGAEDDRAYIICDPGSLPEGFERTSEYHRGYYARKVYEDQASGAYIRFEYRRPTDRQIQRIKERAESAELLLKDGIIEKYYRQSGSASDLFWYDPQRELVFYVESNLDKAALAECFAGISFRLPLYEPTWLPDGFEKTAQNMDYPNCDIIYSDSSDRLVMLISSDMAETDLIAFQFINKDMFVEEVKMAGLECYFAPFPDNAAGGDFVLIDDKRNLVFSGEVTISKEELIKLLISIQCTETDW